MLADVRLSLVQASVFLTRRGDDVDSDRLGFYGHVFDCRVLRRLPAVSSLLVDCLHEGSHLDEIVQLTKLRRLSLGIYLFDANAILAAPNLRGLRELTVGSTKTKRIDLTPVAQMTDLVFLNVDAQDTSIEAVGQCAALKRLLLRSIRREVSASFVNRIAGLESLTMILGGREDIDEIGHDGLRELEVVRVRGLKRIEPERFGRLERLLVEDQIQWGGLRFDRSPSLSKLHIVNCKTFDRLGPCTYYWTRRIRTPWADETAPKRLEGRAAHPVVKRRLSRSVVIYKICPRPEWEAAVASGVYRGSRVDGADGFIHFSTGAQVDETLRRHFAGQRDLVLVAIDPASLGPALRYEPSRGGELFPHLYGDLPVALACEVSAIAAPATADV